MWCEWYETKERNKISLCFHKYVGCNIGFYCFSSLRAVYCDLYLNWRQISILFHALIRNIETQQTHRIYNVFSLTFLNALKSAAHICFVGVLQFSIDLIGLKMNEHRWPYWNEENTQAECWLVQLKVRTIHTTHTHKGKHKVI